MLIILIIVLIITFIAWITGIILRELGIITDKQNVTILIVVFLLSCLAVIISEIQ